MIVRQKERTCSSQTKIDYFVLLGTLPYKMPVFYNETDEKTEASKVRIHHWKPLLGVTFFYFFIACGIERIYQPMVIFL